MMYRFAYNGVQATNPGLVFSYGIRLNRSYIRMLALFSDDVLALSKNEFSNLPAYIIVVSLKTNQIQ